MNQFALVCGAALCWGAAPLIGRVSGIGGLPMAIGVSIGTLLATLPLLLRPGTATVLWSKGGAIATTSGVVNGIGLVAFYLLVAGAMDGKWEISRSLPMVYAAVPIVLAIGAVMFFGESMTTAKWGGLALMAAGFWLLK
jgi:drug/metabolite transporter (DMT)-like permease